jgi:hypothetical protein
MPFKIGIAAGYVLTSQRLFEGNNETRIKNPKFKSVYRIADADAEWYYGENTLI